MALTGYKLDFYNQMWPLAVNASARTGISPEIIFAQGALESSWGRSAPNNNYFGIKGPGGNQTTREFINGQWITIKDSFKGYSSMADSVQGWVDFITGNKRYKTLLNSQGTDAQLAALQKSGYATDPNYSSKLQSIIKGLPSLPSLPGAGGSHPGEGLGGEFGDWLRSLGIALPDFEGQSIEDMTGLPEITTDDVEAGVSGIVDDIFAKIEPALKAAAYVLVAVVLIAAALFLMGKQQTVIMQPAS